MALMTSRTLVSRWLELTFRASRGARPGRQQWLDQHPCCIRQIAPVRLSTGHAPTQATTNASRRRTAAESPH